MTSRVMFLGDVHGNLRFMLAAIDACLKTESSVIVQVGDFGIWDHVPTGVRFLDETNSALEDTGLILVFVDGNHENFNSLLSYPRERNGFRIVRPHIWHAPRGHRWTWSGVNFAAMGGAHSIDAWPDYGGQWGFNPHRAPGKGWWPEESITDEDVAKALSRACHPSLQGQRYADIMVTHDVPLSVPIPGIKGYPMGNDNRRRLETVALAWRPQLLVAGHYHRRHTAQLPHSAHLNVQEDLRALARVAESTRVEILAHDGASSGNYLLVDLDPFQVIEDLGART